MTSLGAMNRAQQAGKAPTPRVQVPRKARRSRQSGTYAAINAIQQENAGQQSLAYWDRHARKTGRRRVKTRCKTHKPARQLAAGSA
jgi:hypothetical protein